MKIISGGQTGADRAALDAAIALGIPHGGWLPKGRKTEDGTLSLKYDLEELPSSNYRVRTERNVVQGDATLICSFGKLTGGSALTEALAIKHERPFLHLDFEHFTREQAVDAVRKWIDGIPSLDTLNVAGPRLSGDPRIYTAVYDLLLAVFDMNPYSSGLKQKTSSSNSLQG